MKRDEYLERASELAARGEALPQAVLTEDQVREIRHAAWKRKEIRAWVRDNVSDMLFRSREREELTAFVSENLTNRALANKYSVHTNTIYDIIHHLRWVHVDAARGLVARKPVMETMQGSRRRRA